MVTSGLPVSLSVPGPSREQSNNLLLLSPKCGKPPLGVIGFCCAFETARTRLFLSIRLVETHLPRSRNRIHYRRRVPRTDYTNFTHCLSRLVLLSLYTKSSDDAFESFALCYCDRIKIRSRLEIFRSRYCLSQNALQIFKLRLWISTSYQHFLNLWNSI